MIGFFNKMWEKDLSYRAMAVYSALLDIHNRCGKNPFTASSKQIMTKLKMTSPNTFFKAQKELIEKGLISYIPSHTIGIGSVYTIN